MRILMLTVCLVVISCQSSTNTTTLSSIDSPKKKMDTSVFQRIRDFNANEERLKKEAAESQSNHKQDIAFLLKTFRVSKILEEDKGCNRLTARYLIKTKTTNTDAITLAMKTFTDSVFSTIPYNERCSPLKCILSVFETDKDFRENNWLALGTKFNTDEAKITVSGH